MSRAKPPPVGSRLDAPLPLVYRDDVEPEPCRYCREPTRWRTSTNRRTHPTCSDGYVYVLTDAAFARVAFDVAAGFADPSTPPGAVSVAQQAPEPSPRARPARGRIGPCSWWSLCGRQGVAYVGSPYLHCPQHVPWIRPQEGDNSP